MADYVPPEPTIPFEAKPDPSTPASPAPPPPQPLEPPPPNVEPPNELPPDLAEDERTRRPARSSMRSSHAASRTSTMTIPSIRSPFFLVTLFLGISAWIFGFVSQAIVTAQISNGPIGTLWLAFILQTILIVWVLGSIFFSSPQTFQRSFSTFAHLASMTTVLAAFGVDNNIFSQEPARKATAAGWLVTAIVDIIWVIYFTSVDGSVIRYALDQTWGPSGNVRASAAGIEEANGLQGFSGLSGKLPPLMPPAFKLKSARLRKTRPDSTDAPLGESKFVEGVGSENGNVPTGSVVTGTPGAEGDQRRSSAPKSLSVNPGASSAGGDLPFESRPVSSAPSGGPSARGSAGSRVKAEALYNYNGSDSDPHELTFVKGDKFEIVDRAGKWWEAINREGKLGIVPSNYVRVTEE
ncbi:hypothetical protein APHAL10511_004212 [Amanita phalloides]|nr:hypothetical protein APHAL10511_004212 [Amanita phalloides]